MLYWNWWVAAEELLVATLLFEPTGYGIGADNCEGEPGDGKCYYFIFLFVFFLCQCVC